MNKPAPKEPSMDEILSSIRQIIADDDAGAAPKKPAVPVSPPTARSFVPQPAPVPTPIRPEPEAEPLALSPEQILRDTAAEDEAKPGLSYSELLGNAAPPDIEATLVDPDDIAFDIEEPEPAPVFTPPPRAAAPSFERPAPRPVAAAAPMPDPTLSADIAEQLLEPTTQSAVKSTFAKLSGIQTVGSGVTIEDMMREMLRPMLKEWLDENLPSVVERMVEKEIARVSRGK
jgi:cell pole-organizing protein PopZ